MALPWERPALAAGVGRSALSANISLDAGFPEASYLGSSMRSSWQSLRCATVALCQSCDGDEAPCSAISAGSRFSAGPVLRSPVELPKNAAAETIRLIPYGCTTLRISGFGGLCRKVRCFGQSKTADWGPADSFQLSGITSV